MAEPIVAWHYDGITALRRAVTVALDGDALRIEPTGERVALSALRPMGDRRTAVFGRVGGEGWRLGFADPLPPEWLARLPGQEHHGGLLDRIGVVPALAVGGALAALAAILLWTGSSLIARAVPERWELAFGDTLSGDLGGNACVAPAGTRALAALTAALNRGGRAVRVRVVDLPIVNAVTLPGRQVVLFRGLVDAARSPDEVAGVLAHELGHVDNRDAMTALLRDFGIGLLIGGADGGRVARALIASRYSRSAERAADAHAVAALARADISPADTAAFFDRLAKDEGGMGRMGIAFAYLSTHPLSAERRRRFLASVRAAPPYRPALGPAEWQALRHVCDATGTAPASPR